MGKEQTSQIQTTQAKKRKRKSRVVLGTRPRKIIKVHTFVTSSSECIFCGFAANVDYGNFFQDETAEIAAHQFCLFFSAGLPQNGEDSEGFDGFLYNDILKEKQRVCSVNCHICRKPGANSGCSVRSCRKTYHYTCGRDVGMQFSFSGAFNSWCKTHRSYQNLKPIKRMKLCPKCPVCLEYITVPDHKTIVRTPCCKNVFIHIRCVQEQAYASGYFFRCPTCNDTKIFPDEMVRYGVFTPSRDASWEENNAYSELLEQYSKCDAVTCLSKHGRKSQTKSGKWSILLCYVCGQSGVHVTCLGKRFIPGIGYVCMDCNSVVLLSRESISTMQVQTQNRLQEHKRRLQELTSRCDPVLLASPVFAAPIWRKKFNIKQSFVILENIDHLLVNVKLPRIYRKVTHKPTRKYNLKSSRLRTTYRF